MKKFFIVTFLLLLFSCSIHSWEVKKYTENITTLTPVVISSEMFNNSKIEDKTQQEEFASDWICFSSPEVKVFMYHYVRDDDPRDTPSTRSLSVTPDNFDAHMQSIRRLANKQKITLMNGDDFVSAFEKRCFPSKNIWIFTADDGWSDNVEYLAPIAEKYNIPFIFGIISGVVGKKWFVTEEDVKNLSKNPLFTIASHTTTHREVNKIALAQSRKEICDSKVQLEKMINKEVKMFIYPMWKIGNNSPRFLKECGYSLAWSTSFWKDLNWENFKPYVMNRIRIHHNIGAKFFEDLAKDF